MILELIESGVWPARTVRLESLGRFPSCVYVSEWGRGESPQTCGKAPPDEDPASCPRSLALFLPLSAEAAPAAGLPVGQGYVDVCLCGSLGFCALRF